MPIIVIIRVILYRDRLPRIVTAVSDRRKGMIVSVLHKSVEKIKFQYFHSTELIAELKSQIPGVDNIFNLHHRIGEGTFSTVFLASQKNQEHLPNAKRKFFAVKHLIPTSHPNRVERELRCLLEIG